MKIGFTYDLKTDHQLSSDEPKDKYAEFDGRETVDAIIDAIKSGGHDVVDIGNGNKLLDTVWAKKQKVDIVFNITEGLYQRSREAQVPAVLDMLNIPYIGSEPLTMAITLDKLMAKQVIISHGLPTPKYIQAKSVADLKNYGLGFPAIVKLRYEGTSKGLDKGSVVHNHTELENRVSWLVTTYKQPVIIEEFLKGEEFTVAVMGNEIPEILPPVQIAIFGKFKLGMDFYIHDLVENPGIDYVCPAKTTPELEQKVIDLSRESYKVLECRDFGRIDIRTDENGNPYFLECNPLPSLSLIDIWPIVAKQVGLTYNQIINRIIDYGRKRYGLS